MPNYEPTPRRFSTLSVPQTPSRRNSFDDTTRPSLAVSDVPLFPPLSSPLDLSAVLKRLQQHPPAQVPESSDGEIVERGRSRQSAGHRRSATAWSSSNSSSGHRGPLPPIQVPSARKRENSASTRERIALWEERSRSQSKGRSKSRTRDLVHAGSRVSVVPEMPELASALAGLGYAEDVKIEKAEEKRDRSGESTATVEDALQVLEGNDTAPGEVVGNDPTGEPREKTSDQGGLYESLNNKDHAVWNDSSESGVVNFQDLLDREAIPPTQEFPNDTQTWTGGFAYSPPQSPQLRPTSSSNHQVDSLDDARPKTPIGTGPVLLPTPDVTPRQPEVPSRGEKMGVEETEAKISEDPWSSSFRDLGDIGNTKDESLETDVLNTLSDDTVGKVQPLTCTIQAEPDHTEVFSGEAEHQNQTQQDSSSGSSLAVTSPAPAVEGSPKPGQADQLADSPTLVENMNPASKQPIEVTPAELGHGDETGVKDIEAPPKFPPRSAATTVTDDTTTKQPGTSYHDVWKITNYAPDFPLPARPTVQATLDHATLARAPFEGTPLQELPRSQMISRAAETYRPQPESSILPAGKDRYPYSTTSRAGGEGDWAVEIPPSPTSTYHRPPDDYRPARQQTRRRSRSGSRRQRNASTGGSGGRFTSRGGRGEDLESGRSRHEWDTPPVIERAFHAASVSIFQGLTVPMGLYRGFRDIYYPPPERPDIIKAYPVRRRLPVRIFFPSHHDLTSPSLLPTLFTIHGGGFTVGYASDDDKWNRTFADTYTVMVISLNYSKAPWACFPAPLHDVEALYHVVLNDESLPIDRMRTALCGFDAGANLALALSQLPSVRSGRDPNPPPRIPPRAALNPAFSEILSPTTTGTTAPGTNRNRNRTQTNLNRHRSIYFSTGAPLPHGYRPNNDQYPASDPYHPAPLKSHPPPSAVIPICGILDFTTPASSKSRTRPYKRSLRGPRGWGLGFDWMARLLPSSAWSYIPYGHDTSDPLLSPVFAKREDLPPHVFVIGAELDCLAHESWRAACSWATAAEGSWSGTQAMTVPDADVIVGRRVVSRWRGCLDDGAGLDAGKFGWVSYHRKKSTTTTSTAESRRGEDENEEEEGEVEREITGSTRWLLVPDVVHGFDSAPWRNKYLWGDEEARMDAEMKTIAYQREMAEWLWGVVWK